MGVNITELWQARELSEEALKGKILAVDAPLFLYQFLSSIRQQDGTPLMDSHGSITSHLAGVLNRSAWLMSLGARPAWVFDGTPPGLKQAELTRRRVAKEEAAAAYQKAAAEKDIDAMAKYARRTVRLTREMKEEAMTLVAALGMPVIAAPAEAEAQAAHMVKQSKAWAVASQDADTLLFGAPRLARNLSASQRRRQGLGTRQTPPELVELSVMLEQQGLTQEQLILLGMLIGTDYNQGGIKGIGPKKALKLVKEHVTGDGVSDDGRRALFAAVKWEEYFEQDWHDVYTLLAHPAVTDDYSLAWKAPDKQAVLRILVGQHEFSLERIEASLAKMTPKQRGLDAFF